MSPNAQDRTTPDTIVLIHGLWLTALSWERWAEHYASRGFRVVARSWPGMEGDIEELRRDPSAIAGLGIGDVVDHYERIITRDLDRRPIIVGHSFGGLITQILLDRGLGAAGVAISPAPVKGVFVLPFSTIKVSFPALRNPFDMHRVVPLTLEQFHYGFTNHLTVEETTPIYERYAVPGPNHLLFQASLANFNPHAATMVDLHNDDRAPLLIVGAGRDHTVPASVAKANYNLYRKSAAVTAYEEYPERTHWTINQDGWEQVADTALDWAVTNAADYVRRQVAPAAQAPGRVSLGENRPEGERLSR
jgi:alpha-beta hydrolase superfamily lysophospholipase